MVKTFCKKCGKEGCRAHPRAGVRTFRMEEVDLHGHAGPKKRRKKARKAPIPPKKSPAKGKRKAARKKARKAAKRRTRR